VWKDVRICSAAEGEVFVGEGRMTPSEDMTRRGCTELRSREVWKVEVGYERNGTRIISTMSYSDAKRGE
jgi:hypothetical protein